MPGPSAGEALTVRELVERAGLGIEVVAGHAGLDRVVEAVYIGDLDDPTPWMVQGSLLLTTGPRLEQEPSVGVQLVRLLRQTGMVGVGVAIMPFVREIPPEMARAADEEGLPLLRIPEGTPFREITSYVFNALASRDMHRLRRSVALQKQLVEVLLAEQDPAGLVRRLGDLLEAGVLLFDAGGRVIEATALAHAGPDFAAAAWREYRAVVAHGTPRSVLAVAGLHVAFREVRLDHQVAQVLMAVFPGGSLISEFADAALTFAQRLLEVELRTGTNVAAVRRRTRPGLLEMLLHGRGTAAELGERLLQHGIDAGEAYRVLALSVGAAGGGDRRPHPSVTNTMAEALLDTFDRLLEERGVPFLSGRVRGQVLALAPLPAVDDTGVVAEQVAELAGVVATRLRASRIDVGISAALTGLGGVPRGAGQARLALRAASLVPGEAAVVRAFDQLGRRYRVLDSLDDAQLGELAEAVVGRLREADRHGTGDLLATLEAYLAHGCSAADTAAALFVHRNTLHKRLQRIEEVLGLDLRTTEGRVEASLGLLAAEVLATRQG